MNIYIVNDNDVIFEQPSTPDFQKLIVKTVPEKPSVENCLEVNDLENLDIENLDVYVKNYVLKYSEGNLYWEGQYSINKLRSFKLECQRMLNDSDYKVLKMYEANLNKQSLPYSLEEIAYRTKCRLFINFVDDKIEELTNNNNTEDDSNNK